MSEHRLRVQGGPHNHTISGLACALKQAASEEFKAYQEQVLKNSFALADTLNAKGHTLVSGGKQLPRVACSNTYCTCQEYLERFSVPRATPLCLEVSSRHMLHSLLLQQPFTCQEPGDPQCQGPHPCVCRCAFLSSHIRRVCLFGIAGADQGKGQGRPVVCLGQLLHCQGPNARVRCLGQP